MKRLYFLLTIQLSALFAYSQWDSSITSRNNLVSTIGDFVQMSVSDGNDGVIAAWQSYTKLMIQRKTVSGKLKWSDVNNPVEVFDGGIGINFLDMISDGKGGAYLSWNNLINQFTYDLYIQHVSAKGEMLFGNNGIKVNSPIITSNNYGRLCLSGDGVIIVWGDELVNAEGPADINGKIFIQRYDATGNAKWPTDMPVSVAPGNRFEPVIAADDNGGAFVCFTDTRNSSRNEQGYYNNFDIYMQHVDIDGQRLWGSQDSALSTESFSEVTYNQYLSNIYSNSIVSDGAGGFIVLFLYPDMNRLIARRVKTNGAKSFYATVADSFDPKYSLRVIPDGAHGIVASWQSFSDLGLRYYFYAQRIATDGSLPWSSLPTGINGTSDASMRMAATGIAGDGLGNYIFTWVTGDGIPGTYTQLKAQKLSANGSFVWNNNGVIVYNQPYVDTPQQQKAMLYPTAVTSADGSVITVWDMNIGINAARVKADGTLYNNPFASFTSIKDGNWDDPTIWNNGVVPDQGADVTVSNHVLVNSNIICNSLNVIAPGSISVGSGFTVTITE